MECLRGRLKEKQMTKCAVDQRVGPEIKGPKDGRDLDPHPVGRGVEVEAVNEGRKRVKVC